MRKNVDTLLKKIYNVYKAEKIRTEISANRELSVKAL